MKKQMILIVVLIVILGLILGAWVLTDNIKNATTTTNTTSSASSDSSSSNTTNQMQISASNISVTYDASDTNTSYDDSQTTKITLNNNETTVNGSGATVSGSTVTINKAGTYYIKGELTNGSLIIDADKSDEVHIILAGATIKSETGTAIYSKKASKVIITLESGTTNTVQDATTYADTTDEDEPYAAIFSKTDLSINGEGTLNVTGNYQDGIVSKDTLKIVSGNITVIAMDDGIRGKDYVAIKAGTIQVAANGDGIKSTNDTDTSLGYILIEDGTINITSGNDAIQAQTVLYIKGGKFSIRSGGGVANASKITTEDFGPGFMKDSASTTTTETESMKALKAGTQITIENGTFIIDAADDSIHSNGTVIISNGTYEISTGDDAIHADESIKISNGTFTISTCYEGIEASYIEIAGGKITLTSKDDGINASSGSSSTTGNPFGSSSNASLVINGGELTINAAGDGLDANGSMYLNGGYVLVNGPTSNGNGSLDYDSEFIITGGTLITAGSSGMLQTPSSSSTQYVLSFVGNVSAGQTLTLKDSSGNEVLSFTVANAYQSVIISTSNIKQGETYTLYAGDTQVGSITANSIVSGTTGSGMGGGQGGFGGGNMGGGQKGMH